MWIYSQPMWCVDLGLQPDCQPSVSHTVFPLSPHWYFIFPYVRFPRGASSVTAGVSPALGWGCSNLVEAAMPGAGQPWPLLMEAPAASTWPGPPHRSQCSPLGSQSLLIKCSCIFEYQSYPSDSFFLVAVGVLLIWEPHCWVMVVGRWGRGSPVLVVLHGCSGTRDRWWQTIAQQRKELKGDGKTTCRASLCFFGEHASAPHNGK